MIGSFFKKNDKLMCKKSLLNQKIQSSLKWEGEKS